MLYLVAGESVAIQVLWTSLVTGAQMHSVSACAAEPLGRTKYLRAYAQRPVVGWPLALLSITVGRLLSQYRLPECRRRESTLWLPISSLRP